MPTIVNEIWIAMADIAYQVKDIRLSVKNRELETRVTELFDDSRPGVYVHISQHVVAQKRLNTGYNKCFLSATQKGSRRLYLPGDNIHETRKSNPQILPKREDLPEKYLYLLNWYLKTTGKQNHFSIVKDETEEISVPSGSSQKSLDDTQPTLSNFISNFHKAYRNFYKSTASYRYFKEGPCIHFHKKAINIWSDNIQNNNVSYRSLLKDDNYLDAIYATLTAWGMNKLGGGPKLKDFNLFKDNLILIADYLEAIKDLNILRIDEIKESIQAIYAILDPSENKMDLVAKSKTLHHLHPDIFPPVDKRYTLSLLTKLKSLEIAPTMNGIDFKNYWKVLLCFRIIINLVGEDKIIRYIGKEIMDTSLTKIVDNAIVGFSDLLPT